jgi:dihydrofolate synthase/folylpolyglutamate synthase
VIGDEWITTEERGRLVYQDHDGLLDLPAPRLFGRHQFANAGTAIAALRVADLELSTGAFERGIVNAEWPARMQRLTTGRLCELVPAGGELWLDGGHNTDGGRAVAGALADLEERVSRPLVLIVGMLSTKDAEGFLRNFTGLARRLLAVPMHQDKALPPDVLVGVARKIGIPADACESVEGALGLIGKLALSPPPRTLITGSLYLAGEVLSANGTPPT